MMILLMITLYGLGFLSGFLLSSYKSSQVAAIQHDYIKELLSDTLKLKKVIAQKTVKKKATKKKPTKKVL